MYREENLLNNNSYHLDRNINFSAFRNVSLIIGYPYHYINLVVKKMLGKYSFRYLTFSLVLLY